MTGATGGASRGHPPRPLRRLQLALPEAVTLIWNLSKCMLVTFRYFRHPELYAQLRLLLKNWYPAECAALDAADAAKRDEILPKSGKVIHITGLQAGDKGGGCQLTGLKLMQLMARGAEAGLWADWALGEAVSSATGEETAEILSCPSISATAFTAALLKGADLGEEGGEVIGGAGAALLRRVAAQASGLKGQGPSPAFLRPLGLLVQLAALGDGDLATLARFLAALFAVRSLPDRSGSERREGCRGSGGGAAWARRGRRWWGWRT